MMNRIWNEESGVLTFEWILLITLLVIGIVSGLAVLRDAYILEAAETAEAMVSLNQGYMITNSVTASLTDDTGVALTGYISSGSTGSLFTDTVGIVTVKPGAAATK